MGHFDYHQPDSLAGVFRLLNEHGDRAALIAGGTALLIDIKHGELSPEHLISLLGLPKLGEIQAYPGFRIGALATITQIAKATTGLTSFLSMREAALVLGAQQVQNVATLGGNICKASPGADMVPPLLCLDAVLVLNCEDGERQTPLDGFLTGPDQTALRWGEVLTEIHLKELPPFTGTAFQKIMRRQAVDCSIVAAAARITLAKDRKTCIEARIGLGAVAPNPFRAKKAEAMLIGQKLSPHVVRQAAVQARNESQPITDVRATADYRRMLVQTLVERVILSAAERAAQGVDNL